MMRFVLIFALALSARAQFPNLPGPVEYAFVTPGLSSTGGTLDVNQAFVFGAGPSGGTTFAQSGGMNYYEFNGTNQMLYKATNNFANASTSGTIMARVYLTRATGTAFRVFTSSNAGSATNFCLLQVSGGLPFWDNMSGAGTESFLTGTGNGLVSGRWYTVGFDTGGHFGQLSVDGVDISQTTNNAGGNFAGRWFSNATHAQHVTIGNFKRNADIYSPGRIAALFVWNRRLSIAEKQTVHMILSAQGSSLP